MRVLLVDDEPLTTEGILQYVDWSGLGVEQVETAYNGLDAMNKLAHFHPDIVLSDVRMPKMNGMELASIVRSRYPHIKIIFLSGYSDKQYLKSAIEFRAFRYVEKPVKLDELSRTLRACIDQCRTERSERRITDAYFHQRWLNELLDRPAHAADTVSRIRQAEPRFLERPVYPLAIRAYEREDAARSFGDVLRDMQEWVRERFAHGLTGYVGEDVLLCLAEVERPHVADVVSYAAELLALLEANFGDTAALSVGTGPIAAAPEELTAACRCAIAAAGMQFYAGPGQVHDGGDVAWAASVVARDETFLKSFRAAIRREDPHEAAALLRQWKDRILRSPHPNRDPVIDVYFRLLMMIHDYGEEKGLSHTPRPVEEKFVWQEIAELPTLAALDEYVSSNLDALFAQLKDRCAVGSRVAAVMQYIQAHYADASMTTRTIASYAYLSHTYLCALFKKETGKTINEYITEVRLEKAKALLQEPQLKLYEISQAIGFTDANYFSSMFKKWTGFTPTQYRERT